MAYILVISGKADIFIHEPLSWRGEGVMKWNIVKLLTLEWGWGCAGINEISKKLGRISDYQKKQRFENTLWRFEDKLQRSAQKAQTISQKSCFLQLAPKKRHEVRKLVLSDDFEIPSFQIRKLLRPERKGHRHWTREDMIQAFSLKSLISKAYR